MIIKKIVFCFLTLLLISSCSIKKRTYRNGYYIDWAHKAPLKSKKQRDTVALAYKKINENIINHLSANANGDLQNINTEKTLFILKDTCGDVISLRTGENILARVIEINDSTIKYKKCDNISGPLYSIQKRLVANIKYVNGILDEFKQEELKENSIVIELPTQDEITEPIKKIEPNAIISLALSIVSFVLLFAFIAFVIILFGWGAFALSALFTLVMLTILTGILFLALGLAKKSSKKIKAQPTKYEGEGLILAARIISGILLGIYLLLIAFALFILLAILS